MSRAMRVTRIVVLMLAVITAAVAGESQTTITVKELPPEAIPAGTCTESKASFIGVLTKDGKGRTKLTPKEIGEYVSKRLNEGYSVTLYPQTSGRIFAIAQCETAKR
jgi:hypothetical protein